MERRLFFFNIPLSKSSIPHCGPTVLPWIVIWKKKTTWIYNTWRCFQKSFSFPAIIVLGRILKITNTFSILSYYLPLKEDFLYPKLSWSKFGWNLPSGSREKVKNVNCLQTDGLTGRQTGKLTDAEQKVIRKFSPCVLKRKKPHKGFSLYWKNLIFIK